MSCLIINRHYFEALDIIAPKTKQGIITAITAQVCKRLNDTHEKITSYMAQTHMATRSIFSQAIKSLLKPTIITLKQAGLDEEQLISLPCFGFQDKEANIRLLNEATLIHVPKHCRIVAADEKHLSYYLILRGAVQSSIIQDSKMAKLSVLGPMEWFSTTCFVDNSNLAINYTTCEEAILLKIAESTLKELQQQDAEIWHKLSYLICRSLVALQRAADKLAIRLNLELYNMQ
jgi:CRP-like cAMP-binding protein